MGTGHIYEDFQVQERIERSKTPLSVEEVEDQKLASFETGYSSGWDDALAAYKDSSVVMSQALKTAISQAELSKTAAFEQFVSVTKPLIQGVVSKVLPSLATQVLGQHIVEIIDSAVEETATVPVCVTVSAAEFDGLSAILNGQLGKDLKICSDPGMQPGQVNLSVGDSETSIDLTRVLQDISSAVEAFYHLAQEQTSYDGPS